MSYCIHRRRRPHTFCCLCCTTICGRRRHKAVDSFRRNRQYYLEACGKISLKMFKWILSPRYKSTARILPSLQFAWLEGNMVNRRIATRNEKFILWLASQNCYYWLLLVLPRSMADSSINVFVRNFNIMGNDLINFNWPIYDFYSAFEQLLCSSAIQKSGSSHYFRRRERLTHYRIKQVKSRAWIVLQSSQNMILRDN